MKPAQDRLAGDLLKLAFAELTAPLVNNVDARSTTSPTELRDGLIRQVSAPVRWQESMALLIRQGVSTFIEVGPGKVLSGLMRQISREVDSFNVEDAASLSATHTKLTA
jgi:[acyl-carrier-protein] S-malonyltransferase